MTNLNLGIYLRERRERLDPETLGYARTRRRTPGLRREEVAQRADISTTWYSWLEQGRGGAPSADVLDRVSRALLLTDVEREHLFLLGLGRLPDVQYRTPGGVTPRLQGVLDAMDSSPAFIRTVSWDVVAWNAAAAVVLTDYDALLPVERNILRLLFLDQRSRTLQLDWEGMAQFVVAVFRADIARARADASVEPLVGELRQASADFARIWDDGDVRAFGDGLKQLRHPVLGDITLEYSAFSIDGRPDLSMLVYNPTNQVDAGRIRALKAGRMKS
ncbi:helix-turn-helix transcriptional regulator [Agrobacterium tumefaciens]|uniref:helix-turn-helix transcriptional regulator n=1 Tax=Agrobacterium tumefaciens TaxID=358 RepID=UPI00054EF717|nr:helix-turn-helix transcriptional regulator [Agrobacterium tumefaciens]